jgi:hypothetical protein
VIALNERAPHETVEDDENVAELTEDVAEISGAAVKSYEVSANPTKDSVETFGRSFRLKSVQPGLLVPLK